MGTSGALQPTSCISYGNRLRLCSLQELGRSELPAVRNNIVIALADMCVHFTALVDAHIPRIAACIRDPCELVRRQVCKLLSLAAACRQPWHSEPG